MKIILIILLLISNIVYSQTRSSGSGASSIVSRDANSNITGNNWLGGYATTATAAGTTTLTVSSAYVQFFTGSTTQTVTLPVVTTLTLGHQFVVVNNSTGAVTINSSGGNAVIVLAAGTSTVLTCILITGTTAASWSQSYSASNSASGKKLTISNSLTLAGTDGKGIDVGAATSNTVLKGNGTNYVASTETYAAPSTAGNFLMSDGTNWTAANTRQNWTSFVVSGSNATTTGQTLVDVTGLTSGTLANSTLYEVEAWLNVTTSAVTTGTEYGIGAGGSGGAAVVMVMLIGNSTGTTITTENIVASATASSARLLTSGQSGMIYLHGWVTTRGAGTANISIQHLKVTSGTSTVLIGSLFRYRLAN